MFVLLYNHIHNLCVSDTLLCIIDSVLVCMFESFLLLVQNLHQWSTTEIKFVSPAISRLYMNKVQLVPQEHFLLTALLTACFQWRLGPIKQDSVSWTSSYWYDRSTLNYCNKNPPDTPNIPIESLLMNPDLNAPLTYKLTLERKTVLAAEIPFLIRDQNKATTTYYSAHVFESRQKRSLSQRNWNWI